MRRLFTILMLLPLPSLACWTGVAASSDHVTIHADDDVSTWSPALAERYAQRLRRIEALLPADATVSVRFGAVEICQDTHCTTLPHLWTDGRLRTLFELVADGLEVTPKVRQAARHINAPVWTLEVARTADASQARDLVERLSRDGQADPGFLEASAQYEATDPTHIAVRQGLHLVRIGAYLSKADALAAQASLGGEFADVRVRQL